MPQLWTETFITQYFWLLLILLTFYYFIATKVIPVISESIKARQITETDKTTEAVNFINDKSINLFSSTTKQDYETLITTINWDTVNIDWLSTNPENDTMNFIDSVLINETKIEIEEENEMTLEEFLQSEENPAN